MDRLGELEQLTLLAVWRLEETDGAGALAGAVRDELEARAGRELTLGAIYLTLSRLQEKGLVESDLDGARPVRGGKARRHYRITAPGRGLLHDARARLLRMWEGLEDSRGVGA